MSEETVARRYSLALADVVLERGESDVASAELADWNKLFQSTPELQNAFGNPAIPHVSKEKLLDELISRTKPSKTTANFLRVLLKNGRFSEIGNISRRFASVLDERSGLIAAEVISARDLKQDEKDDFRSSLEKLTRKKVTVNYSIDKDIIGGVVARIGSTVYDSSVKTKLENLREQLVNSK
jgi:F-type H+-transporting ATPase subunit delta